MWSNIVLNLELKGMIDGPIADKARAAGNVSSLIQAVKRIVVGSETWSYMPRGPPKISFQTKIPFLQRATDYTGVPYWQGCKATSLGGRFVLLEDMGVLECWRFSDHRRIWRHQSSWVNDGGGPYRVSVQKYCAEVIEHGDAAVVVIMQIVNGGSMVK